MLENMSAGGGQLRKCLRRPAPEMSAGASSGTAPGARPPDHRKMQRAVAIAIATALFLEGYIVGKSEGDGLQLYAILSEHFHR